MKNKEKFFTGIETVGENNVEIKEVYNFNLNNFAKLFKYGFSEEVSMFKLYRDVLWFTPGKPKETSVGKLNSLLDKFIQLIKITHYLGKTEKITNYLKTHGITLEINTSFNDNPSDDKKYKKQQKEMSVNLFNMSKVEVLNYLLQHSLSEFRDLTAIKEENEEIIPDIALECEVRDKIIKQAIQFKTKQLLGKDISEDLNIVENDLEQLGDIIEEL